MSAHILAKKYRYFEYYLPVCIRFIAIFSALSFFRLDQKLSELCDAWLFSNFSSAAIIFPFLLFWIFRPRMQKLNQPEENKNRVQFRGGGPLLRSQ